MCYKHNFPHWICLSFKTDQLVSVEVLVFCTRCSSRQKAYMTISTVWPLTERSLHEATFFHITLKTWRAAAVLAFILDKKEKINKDKCIRYNSARMVAYGVCVRVHHLFPCCSFIEEGIEIKIGVKTRHLLQYEGRFYIWVHSRSVGVIRRT